MSTLAHFSSKFSIFRPNSLHGDDICKRPNFPLSQLGIKFESFHLGSSKLSACRERWSLLGGGFRNGVLLDEKGCMRRRRRKKKIVVLVRNNQRFGFNGIGGGDGGGRDGGNTARILGNLALAIGLTYLSMTGQLGWILDAIVSI